MREALPGLLRELGVKRLLDAPCGDCNWISKIDLGVEYIGCDVSPEHLAKAAAAGMNVIELDIVYGVLPASDLMLCRDFHQHLPDAMVFAALYRFKLSGIPWLLATSHDNAVNTNIRKPGEFRPINLKVGPFYLGEPERAIDDGKGRILGLWRARSVN